ncbi:MAG: hypothetical protein ABIL18_02215 [candidate division WOR-3 bacterium]
MGLSLGFSLNLILGANFVICNYTANQQAPCVIYGNNQFYVFWSDLRYYNSLETYALYGARVTNSGSVLDPNGKLLFNRQAAYPPKVAYDGINLLVALRDSC